MNCYLHPETPATAFCRSCGRSLCPLCQRPAEGTIYCQDHVPATAYTGATQEPGTGTGAANPYFQQGAATGMAPVRTSPGLAFALGLIPGVGAIYNGQYLKGLVHALFTGLLITITDSTPSSAQALTGLLLTAFWLYMPFEAYHTAKKRQLGIVPDEWSSILPAGHNFGRAPVGPVVLIAIGVLYLLNTLNLVDFHQLGRFWPVILILAGAYMLYSRVTSERPEPRANPTYTEPQGTAPRSDLMGSRHD